MTSEKAIQLLHRLQDEQFDGIHGDERREALEMAVRALEQNLVKESGDLVQDLVKDCISRQAAIDAVVSAMIDGADAELVEGVMELLPSAQPKCRTGKWLQVTNSFAYCNQCGEPAPYWAMSSNYHLSNYCPSCGARMDGETE